MKEAVSPIYVSSDGTTIQFKNQDSFGATLAIASASLTNAMRYTDSRFKLVTTTHDISVTGDQAITGAGFTPKSAIVLTVNQALTNAGAWGFTDGTLSYCIYTPKTDTTAGIYNQSTSAMGVIVTGNNVYAYYSEKTMDIDGMTVTWAKNGSPTGTAILLILFLA